MPDGLAPIPDKVTSRANRALDAVNFFLADVRDGLGPYLAVYLLTEQHWDEARIGVVMSIAALAGIVAQTPAGALVDATQQKRLLMIGAAITHARRHETQMIIGNAVLLILAAVVAWGRFGPYAF